jgi:hypothetical protein
MKYDLKSDPLEKNNLAKEYKDIDDKKDKLLKWKYEVNSMYREYYKNTRNKTDIK